MVMEAEQATEVVEQEAPVEEQVIAPVAETVEAPVADADPEPVAETEAPYVPDLSTIEGIREAAERFPQLKGWREDGFNAGRLKREKELRQEQGSNERAKQYQDHLAQKYGIELDPEDQKALPLFARANHDYLRAQMAKEWAEAALDSFGVAEREVLQSVIDDSADADALVELAGKVWQAATDKVRSSAVADLSLKDIPDGSKLRSDVDEFIRSEVAKELKAREEEARQTPENPPRTPAGGVAAGALNLESMSPADRQAYFASLTDEERTAMWAQLAPGA